jgi:photosystem II stability/assembly factor-like uncharacterized protein
MNSHPDREPELDPVLEAEVRAALRRSIQPPAAPNHVRNAVEAMAASHGATAGAHGLAWRGASALASMAAVVAVVAVIGASLILRGSGPAVPTPRPTVGTPGPVLPDPSPGQKLVTAFSWTGDGLTAWAGSGDGTIRFTADGGVTWSTPVAVPVLSDLSAESSLEFVDRLHGWQTSEIRVAGVWHLKVQRTSDGGLTWATAEVATLADEPGLGLWVNTHLIDATHGVYMVSRPIEPQPAASPSPDATPFRGPETFRDCTEYTTADGGATWTGPTPTVCGTAGLKWVNGKVGLFVGGLPSRDVTVTLDGGLTWRKAELPGMSPDQTLWNPTLDIDDRGVLHLVTTVVPASETWSSAPVVGYASADGGSSWAQEFRSATPDGMGLGNWTSVLAPGHYLSLHQVGTGIPMQDDFVESLDGGRTWREIKSSGFSEATYMSWADEIHGMLDGMRDCPTGQTCDPAGTSSGAVFLTDDGGRTWHQLAFD